MCYNKNIFINYFELDLMYAFELLIKKVASMI